jgi:hypothetical protein
MNRICFVANVLSSYVGMQDYVNDLRLPYWLVCNIGSWFGQAAIFLGSNELPSIGGVCNVLSLVFKTHLRKYTPKSDLGVLLAFATLFMPTYPSYTICNVTSNYLIGSS